MSFLVNFSQHVRPLQYGLHHKSSSHLALNYYRKTTYSYCISTTLKTHVAKTLLESPLSNCHVIYVKCKCPETHSGLWHQDWGCPALPPALAVLSPG